MQVDQHNQSAPAPPEPAETVQGSLCIAHVDAETEFSGGEVQVFALIDGLRARGHRGVVFCPPASACETEARQRDIPSVPVRMRNDFDLASVLALARRLRSCAADVVHLHTGRATWLGGLAARLAHVPALSTRRMDRPVKRNWRTRLIYGYLVQAVVPISPAVAECLSTGGVGRERMHVIPDAVDPTQLAPRAGRDVTRTHLGAGPQDQILLAPCALVRRKGLDLLLDALALIAADRLRPRLWIAGDGPERRALTAQAEQLGLTSQVRFLGQRRDMPDLLAGCDVVVVPSRREGMGVAALEAMATGRPVVCSAAGGLPHAVVDGRTGLLFPPGDTGALARALTRVLRDDALRSRLGQNGPERVREGFLVEQMVAAYDRLYRAVVDEWQKTSAGRRGRA
jgi:L-malate glycosyltransferase